MSVIAQPELVRDADLEIQDPSFFRDLLKTVSKVTEEPRVTIDPEGIGIKGMSPDHVAMVDLYIPRNFFWTYNVYEERTISINIDNLLKQVFKRGRMKDTVILMRIEAERIVCEITRGGGLIRKVLPLLEPLEEETPEPKIYFKSSVEILTEPLIRTLEDCKTIEDNEAVLITFEDNEISFSCIDKDGYGVENKYNQYADEILSYLSVETQKAYYTIEHILTLVKALKPITEAIHLELSTNMPMKIRPEMLVRAHDGRLIYYLAPRVFDTEPKPQEDQEVEPAAPDVDAVDVVDEVVPHEDAAEIPILYEETEPEKAIEPEEIDAWTLREARVMFYLDNPGHYDTPTTEQLKQYL